MLWGWGVMRLLFVGAVGTDSGRGGLCLWTRGSRGCEDRLTAVWPWPRPGRGRRVLSVPEERSLLRGSGPGFRSGCGAWVLAPHPVRLPVRGAHLECGEGQPGRSCFVDRGQGCP